MWILPSFSSQPSKFQYTPNIAPHEPNKNEKNISRQETSNSVAEWELNVSSQIQVTIATDQKRDEVMLFRRYSSRKWLRHKKQLYM